MAVQMVCPSAMVFACLVAVEGWSPPGSFGVFCVRLETVASWPCDRGVCRPSSQRRYTRTVVREGVRKCTRQRVPTFTEWEHDFCQGRLLGTLLGPLSRPPNQAHSRNYLAHSEINRRTPKLAGSRYPLESSGRPFRRFLQHSTTLNRLVSIHSRFPTRSHNMSLWSCTPLHVGWPQASRRTNQQTVRRFNFL